MRHSPLLSLEQHSRLLSVEVHLDLMGGIAGDMFIAALLDAFPEYEPRVEQAVRAVDPDINCRLTPHNDTVLTGSQFLVTLAKDPSTSDAVHLSSRAHTHTTWREIRARLQAAALPSATCAHAVAIFALLAEAEASVHGISMDAVEFHEVGAWDSIADVVGAAALIDALGPVRWTASPAPLGSGRSHTAHGLLPVPAPATVRLLLGMPTIADGVAGERVTPTGAALLRYLCPPETFAQPTTRGCVRTLTASGSGFGTRRLAGISNHLRALCFETTPPPVGGGRLLGVIEFEVDDQSGEDLAMGLERLRRQDSVLDVTQTAVFGKKGRMMVHVRVLARHDRLEGVVEACFRETTTIGLRCHIVQGIGLDRTFERVEVEGLTLRVKVVDRPGGATAKTEADDLIAEHGAERRATLRTRAQAVALESHAERVDLSA